MKKILISGPLLSCSGYGEMARFALNSLLNHQDKFDIYVNILNWGMTSWLSEEDETYKKILNLRIKTEQAGNQNFDISLQITIPNEWKKMAPINIGYTAGIETTHISPAWVEPSMQMSKIITISDFSRNVFYGTDFADDKGNPIKITTPIEVVYFPFKEVSGSSIDIDFSTDFNFLTVNQWGPRKNMDFLISNFIDEFRNDNVGLVIKTNIANDSSLDRLKTEEAINNLLKSKGDRKCKVYLIHGRLSEKEVFGLYKHPKIKAFVTATHGEGFGLPIFEAMQSELPVIATDWSAHLEFLSVDDKKMFAKVDYELGRIQPSHVWKGVMEAESGWAYPTPNSLKNKMREVYKDYSRFKSWAKKLAEYNKNRFEKNKVEEEFFYSLGMYSKPKVLTPKEISGISFCIPTHGKRKEKTLKTIKSIQKQEWGDVPYEIIVAGDVDSLQEVEGITTINLKEEAHGRKVALLRNAAAEKSKYETIAFCDDDIMLDPAWFKNTLEYSKTNGWEVLGNKILNPDGTRHWDRGIMVPRKLVPYSHPGNDKNLLQTSGFFMIRKETFLQNKWDETKLVYGDRTGQGIPEDLKFSLDLHDKNISLEFNKDAVVWHCDEKYTEFKEQTLDFETIKRVFGSEVEPYFSKKFIVCGELYE